MLDCVVTFGAGHFYISQSDKGGLVFGGGLDGYNSFAQRGTLPEVEHVLSEGVAMIPALARAARACGSWARHHGHDAGRLALSSARRPSKACTLTAAGATAASRPSRAPAGASRTRSRKTGRTRSTRISPRTLRAKAACSTKKAPVPTAGAVGAGMHADQLSLVRRARRGRIQLSRRRDRAPAAQPMPEPRRSTTIVYTRGEPEGWHVEWWHHCRWLPPVAEVVRHTRTHEIAAHGGPGDGSRCRRHEPAVSPATRRPYRPRSRIGFSFRRPALPGHPGDTLASALLANGVRLVGRSFKYHRPRGIFTAGAEEPNALVELRRGARREPNTRATVIELFDGLDAASQNRWPSLTLRSAGGQRAARPLPRGRLLLQDLHVAARFLGEGL